MSNQTGTLYQDGIELCSVTVLSHTPAQRPVKIQPIIGDAPIFIPQRVIPGLITFTCAKFLPSKHNYSFVQGGAPAAMLYIEPAGEPSGGLYTIHADIGFPGT